jgi:septum formation protein
MLLDRLGLPFLAVAPAPMKPRSRDEAPAATAFRLAEAKRRSVAGAHPDALDHRIGSSRRLRRATDRKAGHARTRGGAAHGAIGPDGDLPHRPLLLDTASGQCQTALVDVRSTFRFLRADEIESYLRSERPYDCAGSVRSEALGIALFERIESDDPTALIGLPLIQLTSMLRGGRSRGAGARGMSRADFLSCRISSAWSPRTGASGPYDRVARSLAHYVVENAKPARAFLQSLAPLLPIQRIGIVELGDAPDPVRCAELLAPARTATIWASCRTPVVRGLPIRAHFSCRAAHREGIRGRCRWSDRLLDLLALMASGHERPRDSYFTATCR